MFKKNHVIYVKAGSLHTAVTMLEDMLKIKVREIERNSATRIKLVFKANQKQMDEIIRLMDKYELDAFI